MNRIVSDLARSDEGLQETNLPDGFGFLLDRSVFEMGQGEVQKYLDGLDAAGEVDEKTANELNGTLDRMGAFGNTPPRSRYIVVAGQVTHEEDKLYGRFQVTTFHANDAGLIRLGTDKADAVGRYIIPCGHRPTGQEESCGQPAACRRIGRNFALGRPR